MSEFSDAIERLFAAEVTPQHVRAINEGESPYSMWQKITDTGFHDALIPESMGGAGLGLTDVFDVLSACGAYCIPVPLAMTMLVRAVLAESGQDLPEGPITVATMTVHRGPTIVCERVTHALSSKWVLVDLHGACALIPIDCAIVTPSGVYASLEGDLEFESTLAAAAKFPFQFELLPACAALLAAQMAGAMERVLGDTIRFANERSQFGRSIGKFQAVQQQISVMAEQVFAARMAAQLGCVSATYRPDSVLAAVAKARASEAVVSVTAIAHAVHGAMGIAEEYDLQLFTRRLHEWRLAFGSESCWNRRIGQLVLESPNRSSVDFVRERIFSALA